MDTVSDTTETSFQKRPRSLPMSGLEAISEKMQFLKDAKQHLRISHLQLKE
jgi:hypothetical protein